MCPRKNPALLHLVAVLVFCAHVSPAEPPNDDSAPILVVIPSTPIGGNPFLVRFFAPAPSTFTVLFAGKHLPLYPRLVEGTPVYETFLTSSISARGVHALAIRCAETGVTIARRAIRIRPRIPVRSRMSPTYTKARARRPANTEENRTLRDALRTRSEERLWNGPFEMPIGAVIVSSFGVQRITADGSSYHHLGVDLRGGVGTPIAAPQEGVVVMVGEDFRAQGNCLVLDHGQGITTCYLHLQRIAVSRGARVRTGDLLGTVGNTGWSTGAHLHYGVYVHGAPTDPVEWTRLTELLHREK